MSPPGAAMGWRTIVHAVPVPGARNMSLDHALAELSPPGEGVLRLYGWDPPTVSFGRNEPARGRYDLEAAGREGLGFVRRPTGGRSVFHSREVTYCVVLPVRAFGGPRDAYLGINEGLVRGLRTLGCAAEVARQGKVLAPDAGPCFQAPAPGEVMLGGRKLVGSAQVRIGDNILQHGSVILGGDQGALSRLTGGGGDPFPPATLEGAVGAVTWNAVAAALAEGMALALGGVWNEGDVTSAEDARARRLEAERYSDEAWTWRR